jgi:hypothetical protein
MRALKRAAPALAAGIIGLTMMSAAAGTAEAATTPSTIHEVPCRSWTFNVTYDVIGRICFEGTGSLQVFLPDIDRMTTGENAGLIAWLRPARPPERFGPHETVPLPRPQPDEALVIDIGHR